MNKVMLLGRLDTQPETKVIPTGHTVCKFKLETTETWIGKDGKNQTRKEWHTISAWGKSAEQCSGLVKGDLVFLEGKIETRSYEDKNGEKKYTTEIKAENIQAIGEKPVQANRTVESRPAPRQQPAFSQDEIPF